MLRSNRAILIVALLASCKSPEASRSPSGNSAAARVAARDSARTDSIARARQDSINRAQPGYIIDSILPVEEQLRRFRATLHGDSATHLANASTSRDALIARFGKALASSDSLALRDMLMTAREFADLVYPESQYTKPPYRQDPALVWLNLQNPSESGFRRLLDRVAGTQIRIAGSVCDPKFAVQGTNRLWNCQVKVPDQKGVITVHRYFGSIIERKGEFKFVSFKNEF